MTCIKQIDRVNRQACNPAFNRISRALVQVCIIGALLIGEPLLAKPEDVEPALAEYETERKLLVLPLHNLSDQPDLDYLQIGIARVLADRLANLIYIEVSRPGRRFLVNAAGQNLHELFREARRLPGLRKMSGADVRRLKLHTDRFRLDSNNFIIWNLDDPAEQARRLKTDYIVRGSFAFGEPAPEGAEGRRSNLSNRMIRIQLELYRASQGNLIRLVHNVSIKDVYRKMDALSDQLRDQIAGVDFVDVHVETSEPGVMVFLDELYLGRTPLKARAMPGVYQIQLKKKGVQTLQRDIQVSATKINRFNLHVSRMGKGAALILRSNPSGADVYLDMKHLGKTPLELTAMEPGTHRLRITRRGYVDRIQGIALNDGKKLRLNLNMQPGHTETAFMDPGYIIFDWTEYDFSFYNFISTLGFYLSYIYFDVQATTVSQSIRSQVQTLAIWEMAATLQNNPGLFVYQWNLIQANQVKVNRWHNLRDGSAALGVFSLISAGYFLYRAVLHDEAREVGEVSNLGNGVQWFFRDSTNNRRVHAKGSVVRLPPAQDTRLNHTGRLYAPMADDFSSDIGHRYETGFHIQY